MGIPELIITAFALSMDAFAVAVCKGLAIKKVSFKESFFGEGSCSVRKSSFSIISS